MQPVVFDTPYEFVPPSRSRVWPRLFRPFLPWHLRRYYGLVEREYRHAERLQASLSAGHGVILAGNHCRLCDPMVVGGLYGDVDTPSYYVAARHVFHQGRFQRWLVQKLGGFSIHREGVDRASINLSVEILEKAERPLVIFPEGGITRSNDVVFPLMDGASFIAHTAAKRRAKAVPPGRVVLHPVALRYQFLGDLEALADATLSDLETRLSWHPRRELPLLSRIEALTEALVALKELEFLGETQSGGLDQRIASLIERLLAPLEDEWLGGQREPFTFARTKRLRSAILPDMVKGTVSEAERHRRWRQLAAVYYAHQFSCYLPDYAASRPSPERILESIEKLEEDLTDECPIHGPMRVVVEVGEAIEVSPHRVRDTASDPLMQETRLRLQAMVDRLTAESPKCQAELPAEHVAPGVHETPARSASKGRVITGPCWRSGLV